MRVGRAVAQRRVEVGLMTQRALAQAAGVGHNTAALLERGRTFPIEANRIKFEDALGWPHGTLDALRRGEPIPEVPVRPRQVESAPMGQVLGIAKGLAAVAAACAQVLTRERNKAVLRELDNQMLQLETLIAATVPYAAKSTFDEAMSALTELHEYRDVVRDAAAESSQSGGEQ